MSQADNARGAWERGVGPGPYDSPTDPARVIAVCPKCGAEVDDLDGFGVLVHDECGYCSHPDVYGTVCRACNATVVILAWRQDTANG